MESLVRILSMTKPMLTILLNYEGLIRSLSPTKSTILTAVSWILYEISCNLIQDASVQVHLRELLNGHLVIRH